MEAIIQNSSFLIKQNKEWGEILTGFEGRNSYSILGPNGETFYQVKEESPFLLRILLKQLRPLTFSVFNKLNEKVLNLKKGFAFFFHKLEVIDRTGMKLGSIERKWSFFNRIYSVTDNNNNEVFSIVGPFFHPWTFEIKNGEKTVALITKKWSGLLKEAFTDADRFGIVYHEEMEINIKSVLLGAVFLIDMMHFERH